MFDLDSVYRWCDDIGGGIVIASSVEDATNKLREKYKEDRLENLKVWPWKNDDYFDIGNVDVFDIYG